MVKENKLHIGQIGVGYWGPNLLRNLLSNPRCLLKTVIDLSEERRSFVKNINSNIIVSDDLNKVLLDSDIKAVIVSTPANTHFEIVCKLLAAGKHVLVEKPIAKTVNEVNQIEEIAKLYNKVVMVGHTFLYNDSVKFLKELINKGELGTLRYIYSQRLNLGRIRTDVDAFWNLAPHDISIIQFLLNEESPLYVSRTGMDFIQKGIEDVVFVSLKYPKNILCHIHVSWLDPNKTRKLVVVGSKKMVVYDDTSEDKIIIYDKGIDKISRLGEVMDYDSPYYKAFAHRSGDVLIPKIINNEPLSNQLNHFLDCIYGFTTCLTGIQHAKNVVGILEAAS